MGDLKVFDQRVLRATAATLQVRWTDQNGTEAAASDAVTVAVATASGRVVLPAGTATTHTGTGLYSVTLTGAQNATVEQLTATWTDAGGATRTTLVDVCSGFFFSLADARASDATLADATKYPDATVLARRLEVEAECEQICDVAFVPRYARVVTDGGGVPEILVGVNQIRTVRSVTIVDPLRNSSTPLTSAQLANLRVTDGQLARADGDVFPDGFNNVIVELEHGHNAPPPDLKDMAMVRLRSLLNRPLSPLMDRAKTVTNAAGETIQLEPPDAYRTGIRDVDAVYDRYSRRSQGDNQLLPAGRSLQYDPQWWSVFHGGRR